MSDNDINRIKQNIEQLQDQNAIDFQQWKRLGKEIEELEGKIKISDCNLNLVIKKIKADYESLRRMVIDENIQVKLNEKIEQNKNEINKKVNNETFQNKVDEINSQLDTKANKVDLKSLEARMDSFTSLPEGSTTGDAELIDARIGADGVTYNNIGEAIRTNDKIIDNKVSNLQKGLSYNLLNIDKQTTTLYGITFTKTIDGYFIVNGTSTQEFWFDFGYTDLANIGNEQTLSLGGSITNTIIYGYFRSERSISSSYGSIYSQNGGVKTFKKSQSSNVANTKCITFSLNIKSNITFNNAIVKPIVNIGGTTLPFIPYNQGQPIKEYVDNNYAVSKNLYALDEYVSNLTWIDGSCLNIKGQPVVYSGCSYCEMYIPISELLLKSTITNLYDRVSWTVTGLCFYDNTKSFIGYYSPSVEGTFSVSIKDIIYNYPNAEYIRLCKLTDNEVKFVKSKSNIQEEVKENFDDKSYHLNMYENVFIGGDSVTEGYVVDGEIYQVESRYAYPTQLAKIIPQWNITVKAKSGASAVSWRNMFYSSIDFSQYDLIIMELGYNGSDFGYFNMDDINTTGTNTYEYKKLIADIRSQNANAEIILVLSSKYTNSGDKWDWKPILELVASESNCKIINLRDKTYLDLNLDKYHGVHDGKMDYVHFNRIGYNAKAFVVSRLLLDVLT